MPINKISYENNTQVINSKEFYKGLEYIFTKLCDQEGVKKYILLIKNLVNNKKLNGGDLNELDDLFKKDWFINYGSEYITRHYVENIKELAEKKIKANNILGVLLTKLISQKVDNILGKNLSTNQTESENDILGKQIYEDEDVYVYRKGNISYILNKKTKELNEYNQVKPIVVDYTKNEIGSIMHKGKNQVVSIPCDEQYCFKVKNFDGQYGITDEVGEEKIPCKYNEIEFDKNFGYRVKLNDTNLNNNKDGISNKNGILGKDGNVIVPCKFKKIIYNEKIGYVVIDENDLIGVYDKTGKIIFECKYNGIEGFVSSVGYLLKLGRLYGVLDTNGKEIEPFVYEGDKLRFKNGEIQKYIKFAWRNILDTSLGFSRFFNKIFEFFRILFA